MYKTEKTEIKHAGHISTSYVKLEDTYYVNIQPIDEKALTYTWGKDVKSNIAMYSDEILNVNDIVVVNEKAYSIEKIIPWNSYKLYALLESDEEVL
ncbi:MAG: hypothetical protein E7I47_10620 [Clostridium sp.]|uniref:hypothetical protein n=1 Tax=Clostridium sp. TaxID=1506 RepID=UPI00290AB163|nr:hypothetical protein [Clostridium sp.]MDU4319751.1 hypothetical protein [Clostridium sp.]